jgi:hypothetical protein
MGACELKGLVYLLFHHGNTKHRLQELTVHVLQSVGVCGTIQRKSAYVVVLLLFYSYTTLSWTVTICPTYTSYVFTSVASSRASVTVTCIQQIVFGVDGGRGAAGSAGLVCG